MKTLTILFILITSICFGQKKETRAESQKAIAAQIKRAAVRQHLSIDSSNVEQYDSVMISPANQRRVNQLQTRINELKDPDYVAKQLKLSEDALNLLYTTSVNQQYDPDTIEPTSYVVEDNKIKFKRKK